MPKPPKHSLPGSIFKHPNYNRLIIKFRGKQYSTGLKPDKQGYALAKAMLEKKFLDYHNLKPDIKTVTFKEAWDSYLNTLINKSERTIYAYRHAFEKIVENENEFLTNDNIERYILLFLKNNNSITNTSINTFLGKFQIFLNYCAEKKWVELINFNKKYSLSIVETSADSFSNFESCRIIKYFLKKNIEIAYLIIFMLETGARVVDSLTLEWSQIDFQNENITFKNKNTKQHEIRMASRLTFKILNKLNKINKDKVFSWKYSYSSKLSKILNRALTELGIKKNRRSFQEFRVSFRMRLEERGVPEHYIEYLLRHSSGKLLYKNYTDRKRTEAKIRYYLNNHHSHKGWDTGGDNV